MNDFISVFIGGFLFSCLLTPLAREIALRYKILDYPESRKVHEKPTPLLGGVALYLSFLATILFFMPYTKAFGGVLLGSTLIFIVSLLNDLKGLSVSVRLFYQLIGALIMLVFGVKISFLPPTLWGEAGEVLLTLFWIIGVTNAMNFMDGLDGLVGGLSVITGIFFYVVALQVHQRYFGLLTLAMAGVSFGFLPYNFPAPFLYVGRTLQGKRRRQPRLKNEQAKIFLGDSGACFLGAFYAGVSVMGDLASHNVIALAVPLLLLGVPIFDMSFITVRRILEGKISSVRGWLSYAGKDHFHHRLVDIGFSKAGAVLFIYCIAVTLGINAVVLRNVEPLDAFLLLLKAVLIFILIALIMITGMRKVREK